MIFPKIVKLHPSLFDKKLRIQSSLNSYKINQVLQKNLIYC